MYRSDTSVMLELSLINVQKVATLLKKCIFLKNNYNAYFKICSPVLKLLLLGKIVVVLKITI
jgi:hypothetical protein